MIDWSQYVPGDHRVCCPACARSPKDKTMGLSISGAEHGVAHCFRCGLVESRREQREMTPAERKAFARRMDALRSQHDAEVKARHAQVAAAAAERWEAAKQVHEHPYLKAKDVQAHGLRIEGNHTLLIPLRDSTGKIWSLQSIAPDGEKRFMPGGRTKGCYFGIGKPSGRLVICEGYATGATIHEDTGHAVASAFTSGNLLSVAKALRAKFPCLTLVLAADDDWQTRDPRTGELTNPGLTAATEAARAVGGLLAVPAFTGLDRGTKDSDFNDQRRLERAMEVCQ